MLASSYNFSVKINNNFATEYTHNSKTYIEGRKNSEYELSLHNWSYNNRVLAVFSVDGLSVTDGKPASDKSQGYIVEPRSSIIIPGWSLSNNKVAKFKFRPQGEKFDSTYVEELAKEGFDVDASNQGVIGCMVFQEDVLTYRHPVLNYSQINDAYTGMSPPQPFRSLDSNPRGISGGYNQNMAIAQGVGYNMGSASASASGFNPTSSISIPVQASQFQETSLGTAFGEEATFNVIETTFKRKSNPTIMVINYDTLTNLKRKGVIVEKNEINQAFPDMSTKCYVPRSRR